MISIENITYVHPNGDLLFEGLQLHIHRNDKLALLGANGAGKSTFLKLVAGEVQPSSGLVNGVAKAYYIPQLYGQFNHLAIADAMGASKRLKALRAILAGEVDEIYFNELNDDWTIEERCQQALASWNLDHLDLFLPMAQLSGGEQTKVFLAGMTLAQPELVLLDEPTNHLDAQSRELLHQWLRQTKATVVAVSHDRTFLRLFNQFAELNQHGLQTYRGSYDGYRAQQQVANEALQATIHAKEKALRKAREKEREVLERQQKLDARGQRKQENAGVARIMMNTMRNVAENSTAKLKNTHVLKQANLVNDLTELRASVQAIDQMRFSFDQGALSNGRLLFKAEQVNVNFGSKMLWRQNLDMELRSGERLAIKGPNGSGKTTLVQLLLGGLPSAKGEVYRVPFQSVYIDQHYGLIEPMLNVYEQAQQFNLQALQEHEVKTRLAQFLFDPSFWDKPCDSLSGGERLRLLLCGLNMTNQAPDVVVLDEPTNNLDMPNIELLTSILQSYKGTLVVISHDADFLKDLNINSEIDLGNLLF